MQDDREELLAESLVFQTLNDTSQRSLAKLMTRRFRSAGSPIFHFGDPGQRMMVIAKGIVRVFLPTADGKEIILADLERGSVLGEIALLDRGLRSASAIAYTDCELLELDRSTLIPFLQGDFKACLSIIELLCERIRRSDERMVDIGVSHLSTRLAKVLLQRSSRNKDRKREEEFLTQGELADMVGASREGVNRTLSNWRRQGIVELDDGKIDVRNRDVLAKIAGVPS